MRSWLLWIALGLWHGVCAFFIPMHALATVNKAGATASVYLFGTAVMTSVLVIVTLRVRGCVQGLPGNCRDDVGSCHLDAPLGLMMKPEHHLRHTSSHT